MYLLPKYIYNEFRSVLSVYYIILKMSSFFLMFNNLKFLNLIVKHFMHDKILKILINRFNQKLQYLLEYGVFFLLVIAYCEFTPRL